MSVPTRPRKKWTSCRTEEINWVPMPIWAKGGNWQDWTAYRTADNNLGVMLSCPKSGDQMCIEQTHGGLYRLRDYRGDTRQEQIVRFSRSWYPLKQLAKLLWNA